MESVTSGAPQKSVLEPVLELVVFDIFINDWDYGAEYPSSQPVGYTTVGGLLDGLHGCSGAHQGPDRLQKCGNGNLTKFNTGKSQVLHLGSHSLHPMLGAGSPLAGSSSAERPSGVQGVHLAEETNSNLSWSSG